ncbi:hypothetical protein LCGC14_2044340 [marine sediment metagenome]|uniref:Uncharacterized protein n=1 Tax=marine sediment metagenome TaxID=412755 RepID=A0A0F9EQT3_9ZZZZ
MVTLKRALKKEKVRIIRRLKKRERQDIKAGRTTLAKVRRGVRGFIETEASVFRVRTPFFERKKRVPFSKNLTLIFPGGIGLTRKKKQ